MTDWLEELLEESGEMLRWGVTPYLAAAEPKADSAGSGSGEAAGTSDRPGEETAATGRLYLDAGWGAAALRSGGEDRPDVDSPGVWTEEEPLWPVQSRTSAGDGSALYRRLVQAGRTAWAVRPTGQTAAAEQQSVGTPSLTVDELDRAVRRDSRRYDGAMELY